MSQLTPNEKISLYFAVWGVSVASSREAVAFCDRKAWKEAFGVILISSLELLAPLQEARQFDNDAKWIIFINRV